ncbi:MAG: heme exporter protein CcmB [bacterium]
MRMRLSTWLGSAAAVLQKDLRAELRSRYSLNALLMFAGTTLVIISVSLMQVKLSEKALAALYWIAIFFSAVTSLFNVFSREEDKGTAQTLQLFARPAVIYVGKLFFNTLLLFILCGLLTPLYLAFMNVTQANWGLLIAVTILGTIGLAGGTTIIGAMVAKAAVRGALFGVLSFPVLLPLLLVAIGGTEAALAQESWSVAADQLRLLVAYDVIVITLSLVLFDYVWKS